MASTITMTKAFESLQIEKNAPEAPAIEGLKMLLERAAGAQKLVLSKKKGGAFPTVEDEEKIAHQVALFEIGAGAEFNQYRLKLKTVLLELRRTITGLFPDAKIWATGSFPADVDLPTSDIDVTMEIPSLEEESQKLSVIRAALGEKGPFKVTRVVRGNVPVLALEHVATKTPVDVTLDNGAPKRNTQLLIWYGQVDRRFVPLCRAIKSWAAQSGVENSKKGRLNSCSICLMVIHYLQCGVTPAVLPNLQSIFPELNGEIEIACEESKRRDLGEELRASGWAPKNQDSLGALYLGFFRYFAKFDFANRMISVKNGCSMPKTYDNEGDRYALRYTVVEDPFMDPLFNCARTVNQKDIFDRLVSEFDKAYGFIRFHKTIFVQKSYRRLRIEKEGEERDLMDFKTHPSKFWNQKIQLMRCRYEEWPEQFRSYR